MLILFSYLQIIMPYLVILRSFFNLTHLAMPNFLLNSGLMPFPLLFTCLTVCPPVLALSSLYEKIFGSSPNYSKLRVFGCLYCLWLRPYSSYKLDIHSKPVCFSGTFSLKVLIYVLTLPCQKFLCPVMSILSSQCFLLFLFPINPHVHKQTELIHVSLQLLLSPVKYCHSPPI